MIASELQDYVEQDSGLSVLIVDDSAAVRAAIRQVLELVTIRVLEADNGKDALKLIYEENPDLIVLDVDMPGTSGLSVLNAIRTNWSKLELPVVMITANDSSTDVVRALDKGANDFVSRPLDFDILWARISNQLMQKQAAEYMSAAKDQLEEQVKQRTAELDEMNRKLTLEVEEKSVVQARLKKQANYDHLTNLPNRHLALDRLEQAIHKARRHELFPCVAYIDLDNFKHVNDTLGHAAGDALLREAADRLSACARRSDTVARLGGDEFLLILDDDGHEPESMREHAISKVGDRLLESFAAPFVLDGKAVQVSPSIGFALYGKDGEDRETLMHNADLAMYRSKQEGKNAYCFFSAEMMAKSRIRHFVEANLGKALANGQIELLFEPMFDLGSSSVTAAEVTLRWNNDDLGAVAQEVFMPVAEDSELIIPLTEWMIAELCEQLSRWKQHGHDAVQVAVSLSQRQLQALDLVTIFHREMRKHGLTTEDFMIMLHESVIEVQDNRMMTESLKACGFRVVLTGFGNTGSALSSIHMYDLDAIRTVESCINDLCIDGGCRGMLRTVSTLSEAMGLDLIVTGVTSSSEIEDLLDLGCGYVQGDFISGPVGHEGFMEVLVAWNDKPVNRPRYLELVKSRDD